MSCEDIIAKHLRLSVEIAEIAVELQRIKMSELILTRKDLIAFKRKYTMARNAGVDAFKFKNKTY